METSLCPPVVTSYSSPTSSTCPLSSTPLSSSAPPPSAPPPSTPPPSTPPPSTPPPPSAPPPPPSAPPPSTPPPSTPPPSTPPPASFTVDTSCSSTFALSCSSGFAKDFDHCESEFEALFDYAMFYSGNSEEDTEVYDEDIPSPGRKSVDGVEEACAEDKTACSSPPSSAFPPSFEACSRLRTPKPSTSLSSEIKSTDIENSSTNAGSDDRTSKLHTSINMEPYSNNVRTNIRPKRKCNTAFDEGELNMSSNLDEYTNNLQATKRTKKRRCVGRRRQNSKKFEKVGLKCRTNTSCNVHLVELHVEDCCSFSWNRRSGSWITTDQEAKEFRFMDFAEDLGPALSIVVQNVAEAVHLSLGWDDEKGVFTMKDPVTGDSASMTKEEVHKMISSQDKTSIIRWK